MTTAERLKGLAVLAAKFMKAGEPTPVPTPENFEAVKIKGGETMVEYSPSLEVGTSVMISSGTGSTPAKDETYTLENGVVFVVKDGKIESVTEDGKPKEEPKKDGEGDDKGEYSQEAFDALVAENAELKLKFAELETTVAGFAEAFAKIPTAEQLVEFNANMKEVGSVILELSEIPVNVPLAINPDAPVEQAVQFEKVAAKFGKQD